MDPEKVRTYYAERAVVEHYSQAAVRVGLWQSEEKLLRRIFRPGDSLLELGCGAGRIAMGLWELGFENILATDFCREQLEEGRRMAKLLEYRIHWKLEDATRLSFGEQLFDGVIFGFNGLMQIPGRELRERALREVFRVLRAGGRFVFTTHDRDLHLYRDYWQAEEERWARGTREPELVEFGDRYHETPMGHLFIHVPTREEVLAGVAAAGFVHEADFWRSELANENAEVRDFSDECRFWVVRRPEFSSPPRGGETGRTKEELWG